MRKKNSFFQSNLFRINEIVNIKVQKSDQPKFSQVFRRTKCTLYVTKVSTKIKTVTEDCLLVHIFDSPLYFITCKLNGKNSDQIDSAYRYLITYIVQIISAHTSLKIYGRSFLTYTNILQFFLRLQRNPCKPLIINIIQKRRFHMPLSFVGVNRSMRTLPE